MDIETTITLDMDSLTNELEDWIRECANEEYHNNESGFIDDDSVQGMIDSLEILDQDDVQQLINESMQDLADNTDTVNEITTEYRDLRLECQDMRNEVEKLRRSMRVLLEERDRSIKARMLRAYNAGSQTVSAQINKLTKGW